ncbi:MAG: DUF302 domain-containing protein [Mycobacterium sp.]
MTLASVVEHSVRRIVVPVPHDYDVARELYETLVPAADLTRFYQLGSWQAAFELAEINAPHGFMAYQRIDLTALMAGSGSFWKATQYLMGNHTIAEPMFRDDPSVMLHAPLRVLLFADAAGTTNLVMDQPSTVFASYADPDIAAVGLELDKLVARLIELLGAAVPAEFDGTHPTR